MRRELEALIFITVFVSIFILIYLNYLTAYTLINPVVIEKPADIGSYLTVREIEDRACFKCHEPDEMLEKHDMQEILRLSEEKSLPRKLCVDCHGTKGLSPEGNMTDPGEVEFREYYYWMNADVAHASHGEIMRIRALKCTVCMLDEFSEEVKLPKPKEGSGHLVVCGECHHEEGRPLDLLSLHMYSGSTGCLDCHELYGFEHVHDKVLENITEI